MRNLYRLTLSIAPALAFAIPTFATPVAPYPTAPLCTTHDDRAYHTLWDSARGCHYSHLHGDDPRQIDAKFGTELWDIMGGQISYPWQTFGATGTENAAKHEGYYWIVRENLTCPTAPSAGCITDFRALVHQMADGHDTPIRYHSFVLEARVCVNADLADCGFIRIGGWQDTGILEVDGKTIIGCDTPCGNRVKQHRATSPGAVWYPSSQVPDGGQGFARVSLTIYDEWDYTNPASPGDFTDYVCYPGPKCRMNGTSLVLHLLVVDVPAEYGATVDADGNRRADYDGYLNRYGAIVSRCSPIGLDCIPFKLRNIRTDVKYSLDATAGARDYDIYFCGVTLCTATTPGAKPSGWQQPHQ